MQTTGLVPPTSFLCALSILQGVFVIERMYLLEEYFQ